MCDSMSDDVLGVLIETYWNVKICMEMKGDDYVASINRNILECKDCCRSYPLTLPRVLIETYWNVKQEYINNMYKREKVLIETYWNVKLIKEKFLTCRRQY